jgi:hypothetical protein
VTQAAGVVAPYNYFHVRWLQLTTLESALANGAARPPCMHESNHHPVHSVCVKERL